MKLATSGKAYVTVPTPSWVTNATYIKCHTDASAGQTLVANSDKYNDGTIQVGASSSTRRNKNNITSEFDSSVLYNLVPYKFKYNENLGMAKNWYYGFMAEDLTETFNDAVIRNKNNAPVDLIYNSIFTLAVAEIQKLRRELDELKSNLNMD